MQHYTLAFIFTKEGPQRVLMVYKTHGPEAIINRWNGIGGKAEGWEDGRTANQREVQEETGLKDLKFDELGIVLGSGFYLHLFSAFTKYTNTPGRNDAGEELRWLTCDYLPLRPNIYAPHVLTIVSHALFGRGIIAIDEREHPAKPGPK